MRIYVGNLSYDVAEDSLRAVFADFGEVTSVSIIKDKFTGKSKGFAFIEMPSDEDAKRAIAALDGSEVEGRPLRVNEAMSKPEGGGGGGGGDRRPPRGGGGGGRGGGGGYGGGGGRGGGGGGRGGGGGGGRY